MDKVEDETSAKEVEDSEVKKEDEDEGETEEARESEVKEASPTGATASSPERPVLNIPRVSAPTPTAAAHLTGRDEDQSSEATTTDADADGCALLDDGRGGNNKLTLATLIHEGLIEPGDSVMTIDYLGQTFKGDLLPGGKIRSQETGLFFNNPSAWAIYCKKIVNPAKKSGCGWASVKYKGRKMDHFKMVWTKLKSKRDAEEAAEKNKESGVSTPDDPAAAATALLDGYAQIVRHCQLGPKMHPSADPLLDTLVELETFASAGKMQPFTVSVSSSALLLLDVHAHALRTSVCGYLAGHWDSNTQNLAITHAYPCLMSSSGNGEDIDDDLELAAKKEFNIYNSIYNRHLTLVGWYKSCPRAPRALPTLRESESQLDFQVRLLGASDATYTPCVGLMVRPYASLHNESDVSVYWVIPPPENVAQAEYGRPMRMLHAVVADPCLSQELLDALDEVAAFCRKQEKDLVPFHENFNSDTSLATKMGRSLLPKFPRDQDERLWRYIRGRLLGPAHDTELPDPLVTHSFANGSGQVLNGGVMDEEEEIDDDEENAIRRRGRGSRVASTTSNGGSSVTPAATTDEVISMLLQRQAPVAPAAHGSSTAAAVHRAPPPAAIAPLTASATQEEDEAPLDFSARSNK